MNRLKINYIIDFLALVCFFVSSFTGLIIFIFLPSGIRRGGFQEFMGITKEIWNFFHIWSSILFIVLVVIHLILHWDWIVSMTKNIFGGGKK